MFRLLTASILAIALATPAFADGNGITTGGCPAGQSFATGDIVVTGAFTRASLPGAAAAGGYLVITNNGGADDTLTGASSPAAKAVSLHSMKMNGDIMEMAEVDGGLTIPAKGSVTLAPAGYHLMMTGRVAPFIEGSCVALTLHFTRSGDLPVELNVGSVAQATAPGDDGSSSASGMAMDGMSSMSAMPGM